MDTITTEIAKSKMVKARAGIIPLPKIVAMAFGNGAINANGEVRVPRSTDLYLQNELLQKPIDGYEEINNTCICYCCTLKTELVGENINEIALVDEDGDLLCIRALEMNQGRDSGMADTYQVEDTF